MVITYYGAACFKVQSGETVLAFNPPSKESEFKSPRFQANMVFISTNHKDYNGSGNISPKPEFGKVAVVDGPGEYEISGITIKGEGEGNNTIYVLELEGINLCHLGCMSRKELGAEAKESIGKVDILFVPINGHSALDPHSAADIIGQIEPRIVIPMDYDVGKGKGGQLKKFLGELGNGSIKPDDKFTVKKKDISDKEIKVVVLKTAI